MSRDRGKKSPRGSRGLFLFAFASAHCLSMIFSENRLTLFRIMLLVANGDAGNVRTAKGPADRFGLISLEACEAGAVELAVILGDHGLGEGISSGQETAGAVARSFNPFLRLVFAFQGADLDDPAGVDGRRL